jgi:hypothetical protein
MPTLASAAPRLRSLNMSWLAMVNDWGLGQLSLLVDMQDLNLRATGVRMKGKAREWGSAALDQHVLAGYGE